MSMKQAKEGIDTIHCYSHPGQGSITVPGCIAATPIESPVDTEEGYPLEMPLVYFYGHASPSDNPELYKVHEQLIGCIMAVACWPCFKDSCMCVLNNSTCNLPCCLCLSFWLRGWQVSLNDELRPIQRQRHQASSSTPWAGWTVWATSCRCMLFRH